MNRWAETGGIIEKLRGEEYLNVVSAIAGLEKALGHCIRHMHCQSEENMRATKAHLAMCGSLLYQHVATNAKVSIAQVRADVTAMMTAADDLEGDEHAED